MRIAPLTRNISVCFAALLLATPGISSGLTIFGSPNADNILGSALADTLHGLGGNDLIQGLGGNDTLNGGTGNDTLLGGTGDDSVNGEDGHDLTVWSNGDGSDTLEGGAGTDTVQVNGADGAGDDFSVSPDGSRVRFQRNNLGLFTLDIGTTENLDVNGRAGNDVIAGSTGLAALGIQLDFDGGDGNDLLIGGDGNDVLRGGSGNDTLLGQQGNDVVLGEAGHDLFVWNNGDGSDLLEGGADNDTAQVNGADGAGDDFSITPNGTRVRFQRNNLGLFTLDIGTTENLDVNGQGGNDVIAGSTGLAALGIQLDLDGGDGNDLLIGGDGNDVLRGGSGNDTLLGQQGNDVVLGEAGHDLFVWNNGDGSDLLEGGADNDTAQVNGADGAGDDFSITPNGTRVRFQRNNLGLFTLDIGTTENLDVNGQGGNDVIAGSTGLAALGIQLDLDGGDGNDLLIGGDGDDVLRGGSDNDTLLGQAGIDVLLGGDGDDLLLGGAGPDILAGGLGDDIFGMGFSAIDEILDFEIGDEIDVADLFTILPPASPGDDLFALGLISRELFGDDTLLSVFDEGAFRQFGILRNFTDGLASTIGNPFRIEVAQAPIPEPTGALLFGAGLAVFAGTRRKIARSLAR